MYGTAASSAAVCSGATSVGGSRRQCCLPASIASTTCGPGLGLPGPLRMRSCCSSDALLPELCWLEADGSCSGGRVSASGLVSPPPYVTNSNDGLNMLTAAAGAKARSGGTISRGSSRQWLKSSSGDARTPTPLGPQRERPLRSSAPKAAFTKFVAPPPGCCCCFGCPAAAAAAARAAGAASTGTHAVSLRQCRAHYCRFRSRSSSACSRSRSLSAA